MSVIVFGSKAGVDMAVMREGGTLRNLWAKNWFICGLRGLSSSTFVLAMT